MTEEEVRKQQIAKLKREVAGVDELFHEDIDRFQKKYGLSLNTVRAIVVKSGKYDHEATIKAREMDALQSTRSAAQDESNTSSGRDTQYGVLQPAANAGAGCFQTLAWVAVIILLIAAGVSLFGGN